ncbi:MAG: STAS domain-containing protein [bacterium]
MKKYWQINGSSIKFIQNNGYLKFSFYGAIDRLIMHKLEPKILDLAEKSENIEFDLSDGVFFDNSIIKIIKNIRSKYMFKDICLVNPFNSLVELLNQTKLGKFVKVKYKEQAKIV